MAIAPARTAPASFVVRLKTATQLAILALIISIVSLYARGIIGPQQGVSLCNRNQGEVQSKDWNLVHFYRGPSILGTPNDWYSQCGQDKTIADIFEGKTNGYFVDLAANQAMDISNSIALEVTYNWTGLCIEANEKYIKELVHRKCKVVWAVAWNQSNIVVNFAKKDTAGGVIHQDTDIPEANGSPVESVLTTTLEDIFLQLKAPKIIDYFSFDVEGAEQIILENFPFDKYTFLATTIERPSDQLVKILERNGYVYLTDHGNFGDKLFIHKTIPNFDKILSNYLPKREYLKNNC